MRDEELENRLFIFEAEFHFYLLKKNGDTVDKWVGLYKYSQSLNIQNKEWLSQLKSQIGLYQEVRQMVEALRQSEKTMTRQVHFEKLQSLHQKMEEQMFIKLNEEKVYIDGICNKANKSIQFLEAILCAKTKQNISQYQKAIHNFQQQLVIFD